MFSPQSSPLSLLKLCPPAQLSVALDVFLSSLKCEMNGISREGGFI